MNTLRSYIGVCLFLLLISTFVTASEPNYIRMTDSEMKRMPESWMIDFVSKPAWNYCNGLELGAILKVWNKTESNKYLKYVKQYTDTIISTDGIILGYNEEEYNIDKLNSGKMLFDLYKITHEEKLIKAVMKLRHQMKSHPRTSEGGFWHKKVYPNQMWLDGIYMGTPFLAEYAKVIGEDSLYDDVANQILLIDKHNLDPISGLYYHGWDESRQQRWANPQTGCSANFWSRSIGWYMMAIVDVLDFLPENHSKRSQILEVFNRLSLSVAKFQDPHTGMWFQVTDKIGQEGNYLEATGSAMFIYSWVKGGLHGYLPGYFIQKGQKAYSQFVRQFVQENADGTISITSCCAVAGLGGNPNYRDGSYQYYISEPIRDNDPKAVGPFILVSLLLNK